MKIFNYLIVFLLFVSVLIFFEKPESKEIKQEPVMEQFEFNPPDSLDIIPLTTGGNQEFVKEAIIAEEDRP